MANGVGAFSFPFLRSLRDTDPKSPLDPLLSGAKVYVGAPGLDGSPVWFARGSDGKPEPRTLWQFLTLHQPGFVEDDHPFRNELRLTEPFDNSASRVKTPPPPLSPFQRWVFEVLGPGSKHLDGDDSRGAAAVRAHFDADKSGHACHRLRKSAARNVWHASIQPWWHVWAAANAEHAGLVEPGHAFDRWLSHSSSSTGKGKPRAGEQARLLRAAWFIEHIRWQYAVQAAREIALEELCPKAQEVLKLWLREAVRDFARGMLSSTLDAVCMHMWIRNRKKPGDRHERLREAFEDVALAQALEQATPQDAATVLVDALRALLAHPDCKVINENELGALLERSRRFFGELMRRLWEPATSSINEADAAEKLARLDLPRFVHRFLSEGFGPLERGFTPKLMLVFTSGDRTELLRSRKKDGVLAGKVTEFIQLLRHHTSSQFLADGIRKVGDADCMIDHLLTGTDVDWEAAFNDRSNFNTDKPRAQIACPRPGIFDAIIRLDQKDSRLGFGRTSPPWLLGRSPDVNKPALGLLLVATFLELVLESQAAALQATAANPEGEPA